MKHTTTLVVMAFAAGCAAERPSEIVIDNVTVVDVETGEMRPGVSVRTRDGRIESVGPTAAGAEPGDALVVDGSGAFAIPGLWDMHVHALNNPGLSRLFLTLFVANGITGFRDTWGSLDVARQMEALAADDGFPVPRFVLSGNLVDGPDPVWATSIVADSPERGRGIVDSLVKAGAGFIKVYSKLAPEVYHAIAERANELAVPFAGHVPARVSVREAAAAGQRSMEHLYGVVAGCSTEHEALITEFDESAMRSERGESTEPQGALGNRLLAQALDTQPVDGCGDLFATFKSHETWQVPTLVTLRGVRHMGDPDFQHDSRLEFVPSAIRSFWNPGNDTYANFASETQTRAMARERELVGMMATAGVPILAGSDTPNPYAFPGFGLHDELTLLVESGLSPLDALRAATIRPAEFLGGTDSLGTVDAGKVADFVLLDGNPLEDIENVRRIRGVMMQGRYFDRDELDAMLEEAKRFSRGG